MHSPLIDTPMMRIGFKKSAVLSLAVLTTLSALMAGCKKPAEQATEAVAADVKAAEETVSGTFVIGQSTAPLGPASTTLTISPDSAAELIRRFGSSGTFSLIGAAPPPSVSAALASPIPTATVSYSAVNATSGQITITPTGLAFPTGSLLQPSDTYPLTLLSKTLSNKSASPAQRAIATIGAGHAEVRAADGVLGKIDEAQNRLERLLGRVSAMSAELQSNNVIIAGLAAKEPTKALAEIEKTATAAKTGEQGIWYPGETAPIFALATIDKSIADLTARADAMKASHADMEKKRNESLSQAEKLAAQSEQTKGKQSVDLYVQAANLRKTASTLSTQMQRLDSDLAGNAREVAVAQAQQAQIQVALTKFAEENKQVAAGWDAVKKRMDDVVAKSKGIVEGGASAAASDSIATPATAPATSPTTSPSAAPSEAPVTSLAAAGDQIVLVLAELDKLRKDAKDHLAKADAYYAEAAKLNKSVASSFSSVLGNVSLRESPSRPAWQWMVEIHNEVEPALLRAEVSQRLARLYADEVIYSNTRQAILKSAQTVLSPAEVPVKTALESGKVELPKTLDAGTLEADIAAAKSGAADAFKQSETLLDQVIKDAGSSDTGKSLLQAANVTKMIEQYGHWAYANAIGDKDADIYKKNSGELATALVNADNVPLPLPLPPEIAPTPPNITSGLPTSTTTASTQPGDTTQPATGPATTQDSATTLPATGPASPDAPATAPTTTPAGTDTPAAPATPAPTPAPAAPGTETPAAPATPPATPAPAAETPATPPATPAAPGAPPAMEKK